MRPTLLSFCCCLSLFAAEPVFTTADGAVTVTTPVYAATIARDGAFALALRNQPALAHAFPAEGAVSVNRTGAMVAVRSGGRRIEWTFAEDRLGVVTDGYAFEWQPGAAVTTVCGANGANQPYGPTSQLAGGNGCVVGSADGIAFSIPFHLLPGRFLPTAYCNGSLKAGALLGFEVVLGRPVDALQLLSGLVLSAPDADDRPLRADGNRTYGLMHLPDGAAITLRTSQGNQGGEALPVTYKLVLRNHHVAARTVAELSQTATVPARGETALDWKLPPLKPGFYLAEASAWRGEQRLTDVRQTICVDLPGYRRPLTRPADFAAFWQRQDAALRATPIDAQLRLVSAAGNPHCCYEVSLAMPPLPKPWRVTGVLSIPAGASKALGVVGGVKNPGDLLAAAAKPEWTADALSLQIVAPEEATFTRWVSAEDNNLLASALAYIRAVDLLAARPECDPARIQVTGASRGGPLAIIAAARRPGNVCAVAAFVHTSAGLSWTDLPYSGWGLPNGHNPADAAQVAKLAAMAAYVDPVNHAPDVRAPCIAGYGADDFGLSPPQGIEAMFHHLGSRWKRIARDAGGHVYSDGYKALERELAELVAGGAAAPAPDARTLREH